MSPEQIPAIFQDPAYKRRRFQNWMLVGLLYAFFYMTRYNFSATAPVLMDAFGWTKVDLSLLETALPFVYGLAVLVNAPIADRIGGRKAFLFGAVGVVIMNTVFGLASMAILTPPVWSTEGVKTLVTPAVFAGDLDARQMAYVMSAVWACNAYFQSFGALSIVKINAQWFHTRERGTFGAIFGVLIRLGLILAFSGTPLIAQALPWQYAFWIPAVFVAVFFFLTLFFVAEKPEDLNYAVDTGEGADDPNVKVTIKDVILKVVTSRAMWTIAIASVMIGFVRRSIVDSWWPVYFKEVHGVAQTDLFYQLTAWGIALMGITGGFVLGPMSDKVYGGRRAPVVVIGFSGMAVCLLLFYASDMLHLGTIGAFTCITLMSFFVNGAHGLIGGAASMDFGGRKGAATAAGLFDGMQYFFAAPFTGLFVGWITTNYGWDVWKLWPLPFAIVGALVMATLWNVLPKKRGGGH